MTIGKREQIVLISIGTLLAIALIHMFIYKPKAEQYARVDQEFKGGVEKIKTAEQPTSDKQIENYNIKTREYQDELTSVVASLNLTLPDYYTTETETSVLRRLDDIVALLEELNRLRNTVQRPALMFLNDRRANPADPYAMQMGWNLPPQLPSFGVAGALWDTVKKLDDRFVLLNAIQNPNDRLRQRVPYNKFLQDLGINPAEVSNWVINLPGVGYVFFNDSDIVTKVQGAVPNPLSTNRFGVLVPELKKAWVAEQIWKKREPSTQITRARLYQILEVNLPLDMNMLVVTKQLAALVDIVKLAQQNQIVDIPRVNLLKPTSIGKGTARTPGLTPTPTPTATPMVAMRGMGLGMGMAEMMGMEGMTGAPATTGPPPEETIGGGTGLEIWFRGSNSSTVKFLFDVTHMPRTYALDDLNIDATPEGMLNTSATIEMVTTLDTLKP